MTIVTVHNQSHLIQMEGRVIAFFEPGIGRCLLNAVIWDPKFPDTGDPNTGTSAARVRINLEPGQILHIDSDETTSLNL